MNDILLLGSGNELMLVIIGILLVIFIIMNLVAYGITYIIKFSIELKEGVFTKKQFRLTYILLLLLMLIISGMVCGGII